MTHPEPKAPQPWGSLHSTHSGIERDWCANCRDEPQLALDQPKETPGDWYDRQPVGTDTGD